MARILAALMALAWTAGADAATAGVFQFVAGDVKIVSAPGAERPARKGTLINVGELVATGADSTAQIKMGDGGIVVVQPRSRLTVAVFTYSGAEDGTERVVFRLEQGGFRSVTGAIGHTHKNAYSIETPVAHMGVRGTDHESYYFAPGSSENPGAYNKVNTGLTFISTPAGEVLIAPNQVGYVRSAQESPGLLPSIPGFFNRAVAPRTAQPRGLQPGPIRPPVVVQTVHTEDGFNLSNPQANSAPPVPAPTPVPPVVQGEGAVAAFTQKNGTSQSLLNPTIVANGATFANAGGDSAWSVDWGTWQGGAPTVNGTAANGPVHVMHSTNLTTADQLATLAATGMSATYNYIGGPAPTNQAGTTGTINSLSVGVNFATQQVTSYAVNATVGSGTWQANGSGSISQFTGSSGIGLSGKCTGCTPGNTTASGSANGAFVGPGAEKMITSFGLKASNEGISGSAYLGR